MTPPLIGMIEITSSPPNSSPSLEIAPYSAIIFGIASNRLNRLNFTFKYLDLKPHLTKFKAYEEP